MASSCHLDIPGSGILVLAMHEWSSLPQKFELALAGCHNMTAEFPLEVPRAEAEAEAEEEHGPYMPIAFFGSQ